MMQIKYLTGEQIPCVLGANKNAGHLKHSIRTQIPEHAGKGLLILHKGEPVEDSVELVDKATYYVAYSPTPEDDETLFLESV